MSWQRNPNRPGSGVRLCALSDVVDQGGFEVVFGEGEQAFRILLLRSGQKVWSYINNCPHFSLPLNFQPQTFVTFEDMVVCAHHTAFFKFNDGSCTDGPCAGTGLAPVPSYQKDGEVFFGE